MNLLFQSIKSITVPERIELIDASQPLEKVIEDVKATIHDRFSDLF